MIERSLLGGSLLLVLDTGHAEQARSSIHSALTHLPAFFRARGVDIEVVSIDSWFEEDPCGRPA